MTEHTVGICYNGIVSPDENIFRSFPARVIVSFGEELRIVAYKQAATFECGGEDAGAITCDAREKTCPVVWGTKILSHQRTIAVDVAAGTLGNPDGLVAIFFDDGFHFALDNVVSLIPRAAFEGVLAAIFFGPLKRIF